MEATDMKIGIIAIAARRLRRFVAGKATQHQRNEKSRTNTNKHDQNKYTLLGRMCLRRDSPRIHSRTGFDASLSLSRLPAI
jgi:hypothetical protein